jgi:hypothetical protein
MSILSAVQSSSGEVSMRIIGVDEKIPSQVHPYQQQSEPYHRK